MYRNKMPTSFYIESAHKKSRRNLFSHMPTNVKLTFYSNHYSYGISPKYIRKSRDTYVQPRQGSVTHINESIGVQTNTERHYRRKSQEKPFVGVKCASRNNKQNMLSVSAHELKEVTTNTKSTINYNKASNANALSEYDDIINTKLLEELMNSPYDNADRNVDQFDKTHKFSIKLLRLNCVKPQRLIKIKCAIDSSLYFK